MNKKKKYFISGILLLLVCTVFLIFPYSKKKEPSVLNSSESVSKKHALQAKVKPMLQKDESKLGEDLQFWMNQSVDILQNTFGEPIRKDDSMYGYDSWVYQLEDDQYVQFGIEDNIIQTIFAIGNNISVNGIEIGTSYDEVSDEFSFKKEITYSSDISFFTFKLEAEDLIERPVVELMDGVFTQYYFDTETDELSSVRISNGDILLKHTPYEIEYRGKLPETPSLSDKEWQEVENATEKQIFDMTNTLRVKHGLKPLKWDEKVHHVARTHSEDMAENNYFSHYGLDGEGLKERLAMGEVLYLSAGENIAAQYTDAPAVVLGWLNSKEHREAMFKDDFTHLGVGVHRLYYTQNFLAKPS